MKIAVAKEIDPAEPRVAASPDTVKKFKALGVDVAVEPGAGDPILILALVVVVIGGIGSVRGALVGAAL